MDHADGTPSDKARDALVAGEMQHRLRNMLAIVRSTFNRSVETATSLEDLSDHFRGRLDALARHRFELARPGATTDLMDVIGDELIAYASADDPRVTLSGPAVALPSRIAGPLGLALHELVTNSIKYGTLSRGDGSGRLTVEWAVSADGMLDLGWIEDGIPIVAAAPVRHGFGRDYIEEALPYEIDAETRFEIVPGGIRCAIRVPLGIKPDRSEK